MNITQTEIDELRRLHEAATPGPWETSNLGPTGLIPAIVQREPDDWVPIAYFADDNGEGEAADMEDNRPLIVAARNALPRLLAALEEAQDKLAKVQDAMDTWFVDGDDTKLLTGLDRAMAAAKVQP